MKDTEGRGREVFSRASSETGGGCRAVRGRDMVPASLGAS